MSVLHALGEEDVCPQLVLLDLSENRQSGLLGGAALVDFLESTRRTKYRTAHLRVIVERTSIGDEEQTKIQKAV